MKKGKRFLSLIMTVVIIITSLTAAFLAYAQSNRETEINKALLESIINDRYWVIETLADGDISNNPYAETNPSSVSQTIMDEVLDNYKQNVAFKILVDAMDKHENPIDYIKGFGGDILTTINTWLSIDEINDLAESADALKFEDVFSDMLQTDYESSWGQTLNDQNMDLETLKQRAEILDKLSAYQTALKDVLGLNFSDSSAVLYYKDTGEAYSDYDLELDDYIGHFLSAYEQDLEEYINGVVEIPALEGNEALKKKVLSASALTLVTIYEKTVMPETHIYLDEIFYDGFFDDTMKILKGTGKLLKIAKKTTNHAILMEAIQSQKSTFVDTMTRIAENCDNPDLSQVCENYADLINSAGDEKTYAYESITNYLRNDDAIANIIFEVAKKQGGVLLKEVAVKFGGAKGFSLMCGIATAVAIFEIGLWAIDEATGIKDTAQMVYLCSRIELIINDVVKIFYMDYENYLNNKTEENAEKVLSDLDLLKQLRLYGEKKAYGSMSAQMDSWIGLLLGGGDTKEYLDRRYQASIDTFLGCTLAPVATKPLVLSKGETLVIKNEKINSKTYCCAELTKSDGSKRYFAEADLKLMGGVELNGATLKLLTADKSLYIPLVQNDDDGGRVEIYCDNISLGSINNSAEMSIEVMRADKTFDIIDSIENSGTLNLSSAVTSFNIPVYGIKNNSNAKLNMSNCELDCKRSIENNGAISGTLNVCYDGVMAYENAYFRIIGQSMSGTGTYTDLIFKNPEKQEVMVNGSHTVSNFISNKKSVLRKSENIYLTANCAVEDNYFNAALSFKDYTSPSQLTIKGISKIYNNVTFTKPTTFNDGLSITSQCNTLTLNGATVVKGDMIYAGGTINGDNWLKLHGDANITAASPSISNLDFVGKTNQRLSSSNELTVTNLNNNNTSLNGVDFDSVVNVTGTLQSGSLSNYKNGKNVVLTGTAKLSGSRINGNISAKNWTCSNAFDLDGCIYPRGDIVIGDNITLKADSFIQSSGTLTVGNGAAISVIGSFGQAGTTTNNSTINVGSDAKISGAFTGGTLEIKGDLSASAALKPDNLIFKSKASQSFSSSSETSVKKLTLDNTSNSGINIGSSINIVDALSVTSKTKLTNGKNLTLTNTAKINGEKIYGDISAKDWTCDAAFDLKGALYTTGNIIIEKDKVINILEYNQSSGTLTVGENASINTDGNFVSSAQTSNAGTVSIGSDSKISGVFTGGTLEIKGDLSASAALAPDNLLFKSGAYQTFSNSADTTVKSLKIANSSKTGFNVGSIINVNECFTNECKNLINGENIVLNKNAVLIGESNTKGNLSLSGDYVLQAGETLVVNGNLKLSSGASVTVEDGAVLTVRRSLISNGGEFNVNEGGKMEIDDYLSSSSDTFNIDGDMIIKGDAKITSSAVNATGLITFRGDLNTSSCSWGKPNISFESKLPQYISGSSIDCNNLTVDNASKTGVSFNSAINYYGEYEGASSVITNQSNIIKKS